MKTKILFLFILTAVVIVGLCAEPSENVSLPVWAAVMLSTKAAAFLAAWGMGKILDNLNKD